MTREINEFDLPLMAMGKEASRAFSEQMNPTEEQMEAGKAPKCPKCGSGSVAQIIWGDPVYYDGLIRDIDEGRVHIGGCCITGNDPDWHCNDCEEEF